MKHDDLGSWLGERWLMEKAPARVVHLCHFSTLTFACLLMFAVLSSSPYALAQMDLPVRPAPKPRSTDHQVAPTKSFAPPVVKLKGRFHLRRLNEVLSLAPLGPVVASIAHATGPVTIGINPPNGPLLTLSAPGKGTAVARIHIQESHVHQADLRLALENVEASAVLGNEEAAVEVKSMRIRPQDLPYWNLPVDLVMRSTAGAGTLSFGGTATSAEGRITATFDGEAGMQDASGRARFELGPLAFTPDGLQPHQLVPALGASLTAVRGTVAANGTITWNGGTPTISGRLFLRGLSFVAAGVATENLSGTITLERIWPPQTPPGQVLTIGRIHPGLEASDGIVRFHLDDRGRLRIEQAAIGFSGGRLSLDPVTLDPAVNSQDIVIRAQGLDLQKVLDAANMEAASASGSVSGRIPVTLSRQGFLVKGATLAADAKGFLRYRPSVPPDALQQEDGNIALLSSVLTNFHYERFTVTLDGGNRNEWDSTVHLAGSNPDVLEGHPFILNVTLSVTPGEALVELGSEELSVGDTLPLYSALFGLGFLEWLGNTLTAIDDLIPSPNH